MGSEMSPVVALVVALIAIFIAWKVLKGLVKTVVLIGILLLAGWFVFGGGLG